MKNLTTILFSLALLLSLGACKTVCNSSVNEAIELIRSGQSECVLIMDGKITDRFSGHGVSPLLEMYDEHGGNMKNGTIVDKVIGRAAASIVICSGATYVHGEIMSEDALEYLHQHGVKTSCTLLVPRILNQTRDDLCPLEKSVEGIDDPEKALAALRAKIASFSANK